MKKSTLVTTQTMVVGLLILLALVLAVPFLLKAVSQQTRLPSKAAYQLTCTNASPCIGKVISATYTPKPQPTGVTSSSRYGPPPQPFTMYYFQAGAYYYFLQRHPSVSVLDFSPYANTGRNVAVVGSYSAGLPNFPTHKQIPGEIVGTLFAQSINWAN